MANKNLTVGIIGLGVGEQHITGFEQHPACTVKRICDVDPKKLAEVGSRHPQIARSEREDEVLNDPDLDIVSIASYDQHHARQIETALSKGKHVFVEKPLCLYKEEARAIRQALKKHSGLQLSSNLILRKAPRFVDLKNSLQKGEYGQVYYLEGDYNYGRIHKILEGWRGTSDFYSIIYGGGVHIIDLMHFLLDDVVVEVSAYGNKMVTKDTVFKYDDHVVSILKFSSGVIAKMATNYSCVYPHFHRFSVYGTKATFENQPDCARKYTSRDPGVKPESMESEYPGVHKGALITSFVEGILTGKPAEVTAEDVFKSMSVCFALEEAVKSKEKTPVEFI